MKWIKTRQQWLNEAKIRDVIFPKQAKEVASTWGKKYLEYEEITPTNKIKQGTWKLEEEDKLKAATGCPCMQETYERPELWLLQLCRNAALLIL